VLAAGSLITLSLPVARSSTWTLHVDAHRGAEAISVAFAAITLPKVRPARGEPGFQSRSVPVPAAGSADASSRPRSVPCWITYPAGSVTGGRSRAPVGPTSRALPAALPVVLAPGG
jgi:hypothetical protein